MRVTTVYRELRRVEGSMTSRAARPHHVRPSEAAGRHVVALARSHVGNPGRLLGTTLGEGACEHRKSPLLAVACCVLSLWRPRRRRADRYQHSRRPDRADPARRAHRRTRRTTSKACWRHYWNDPRLVIIDPDEAFKIEGWEHTSNSSRTGAQCRRHSCGGPGTARSTFAATTRMSTFYVMRQVRMGDTVDAEARARHLRPQEDGQPMADRRRSTSRRCRPIMLFQQTK